MPAKRAKPERKAVEDSTVCYYLTGESTLAAVTLPDPPTAKGPTTVRVTHANSYGPVGGEVFVRIGDPGSPLGATDFDTVPDWRPAALVEELVWDDKEGGWVAAPEGAEGDTPWCATHEAELQFGRGRHLIEIKFVSPAPEVVCSIVLSNWTVWVR